MVEVGVHEAKTHLSRLLRPVARLVPVERTGRRRLGMDRGRFVIPDDFDAPLPDDLLDAFES